jgi:thiol-disulfide isomerase/thioredoxin
MWLRILILALVTGCALSCQAAALLKLASLKVGTKVYRNVTVLGSSTTDIYFTHAEGIANVKLKYVEPAIQKRFNYNQKSADELERHLARGDTLYHAVMVSNLVAKAAQSARAARLAATTSEISLADPLSEESFLGKTAPGFEVGKWLSATPEFNGKFVLTYFWAPWSLPCRKYIPELNALQKRFATNLVVVALTSESETDIDAMPGEKIQFASALDLQSKFSTALDVTSIPCVLLQSPTTNVCYMGHPAALTEKALEKFLAPPPVEAPAQSPAPAPTP